MNTETTNWMLIFAGLGAVLLELFIGIETGFDLVLVGIALMAGGGVGHMTGSWAAGVSVTIILSFAYICFGRQFVKKRLKTKVKHSNVESLIGKQGTVEKDIHPQKAGQVNVNGEVWRARADTKILKGEKVKVVDLTGVTLHVVQYGK